MRCWIGMNVVIKDYLINNLIKWGKKNCDDFPWRKPTSLFEAAVAEIMLIRTPAEQVLPVYKFFLKKYNSAKKLAGVSEDEIRKDIESLGLRWRASKLKKMAIFITGNSNNQSPDNLNELLEIPGIGNYTASAILTFYHRKRALLIDSNTVRFIERYFNKDFGKEARRNKNLKESIDMIIPADDERAVKFNESLLDFMRKICVVGTPDCSLCFIKKYCKIN